MPPRYYDKIPPFPDLIFQFDGDEPIDRISARWVYPAAPILRAGDPPAAAELPFAILEIFQDQNAGPVAGSSDDNGANPVDDDYPSAYTALGRATAALTAAGWEQVDEYANKDFSHRYFRPPEDQAWKPSRRLYNLNDPNRFDSEPAQTSTGGK